MIWLWITLGITVVVAAGFCIGANYMVKTSLVRESNIEATEEAFFRSLERAGMKNQVALMREGREYLGRLAYEDVYITSFDGLRLHAKYYRCGESRRTILLAHGYKSFGEHDFACAFEFYRSRGLNILLIDQRSHGQSEGKYITFGVKERYDIRDWCCFILENFGADVRIVLGGISMGCSSVLLAAGLDDIPKNVCGVVADCGFVSAREQFVYIMKKTYHLPPFPILNIGELICRRRGGFGFSEASTLDAVKKIRIPVLFVHGDADDFVPAGNTQRNFEACASPDKELLMVHGANHGMSYLMDTAGCRAALAELLAKAFGACPENK